MNSHETHGRGDDSGPFESDCVCNNTSDQSECAEAGCGFCAVFVFNPNTRRGSARIKEERGGGRRNKTRGKRAK